MSGQADLTQLTRQLARLSDALEDSFASSSTFNVRAGRGGNANGRVSDVSGGNANQQTVDKAFEDLSRKMKINGKASDQWSDAIRNATGATRIFGESTKQMLARIDAGNANQTAGTRKVTESMHELVKVNGLNSLAVQKANMVAFKTMGTMEALADVHKEMASSAKERKALDDEIAAQNARIAGASGKKKKDAIRLEVEALKKRRATIKAEQEYLDEIDTLKQELKSLVANIDDVNPAFQDLTASTLEVIEGQTGAIDSIEKIKEAIDELTPLVDAQGHATRSLVNDVGTLSDAMKTARGQIVESMKGIGKEVVNSMSKTVQYYREQLKYNVDESDYFGAQNLGMSDGDRSKLLGSNVEAFRGMSGSANNRAIMDSGQLGAMMKTVLESYGESGIEAGERAAQVIRNSQQAGINVQGNPNVIKNRLEAMSEMADKFGMVKSEVVGFADKLAQSGELAAISMKYNGLSADAQADAINKEIEARLKNSKTLRLSTEQLMAKMQYERSQQRGTLENMIHGIMGSAITTQIANDQLGMGLSAEDDQFLQDYNMGMFAGDEKKSARARALEQQKAASMNSEIERLNKAGDREGAMGLGAVRMFANKFSNIYTAENLGAVAAQTQEQRGLGIVDGILPGSYSGDGRASKTANSGRIPGNDQSVNKIMQVVEGYMQDPLIQAAKNTAAMVIQLGILIYQARLARTLMGGGGGPGKAGRLARVGGLGLAGVGGGIAMMGGDYLKEQALANGAATNNTIFDGDTAGASISMLGAAATGATLGAILGPVGMAVGAAAGTAYGVVQNFDTIERNFDTVTKTMGEFFSPEHKLEEAKAEAKRVREEKGVEPIPVKITGEEADAIRSTSIDVSKQTGLSKAQAVMAERRLSAKEMEANLQATMEAKMNNINTTAAQYQNADL